MPINRAANYHNVAGIGQRKGVWRQPYDNVVAVWRQALSTSQKERKRANVLHQSISIEVNSSTPIKESDKVKTCKV